MIRLAFPADVRTVLCLGAHSDDIEIGCAGTVLELLDRRPETIVHWVVLSADPQREREARESAVRLLGGTSDRRHVRIEHFEDGHFPYIGSAIKRTFEELKRSVAPDVVFTHFRADRHQDHRTVSDLTWNTFRDHLVLEYEIPKYDGDLGRPNCFVPLRDATAERKIEHLLSAFPSQANKRWFRDDTFRALMRLRGVETGDSSRYAEAFHAFKLQVTW